MKRKGIKKIKCKICGASFPVLATHIKRKHNLSSKEYLKRFPNAKLSSDEYKKKVSNTMRKRFLTDPGLRKKVASRTFDFIKNKKLTPLLQRDYKSAKICLKYSLWKPSIILYGSIIEAVLTEKNPKAKDFYDATKIAYDNGQISEREYHEINLIRDLRNFVHLHKELLENREPSESWAKTAADICESIINRFGK